MGALDRLASALGRRDEQPNIALAAAIAEAGDKRAVAELAAALTGAARPLRHDAIKALYEIGALKPELIAPHAEAFVVLLAARDNRMVWGALSALDHVCDAAPATVMAHLDAILAAADAGSVIAKDKTMSILAKLAALPRLAPVVSPVLLDRLRTAATNQFPMYAEMAARGLAAEYRAQLTEALGERLRTLSQPAKRARVERVLRRLTQRQP